MNEYVIQGQTLTGIADAIRAQLGTETQYTPESMAAAIGSIQGNGADNIISGENLSYYKNTTIDNIRQFCFAYSSIGVAIFDSVKTIESSAFQGAALKVFSTKSNAKIYGISFSGCTNLVAVILSSESICTLVTTTAFNNTPILNGTGYIYVPDNLVEQYKVETNWATFANQIKGLSEIPPEVQEWLNQQGGAA